MKDKYDIAVFGGGTSGCACAYIAAKLGLKTVLVEKNNYLGGLMTGGLVVPVMKSGVGDLNCEYYKELVCRAKKFNAQITYSDSNDGWFNPEVLKMVLDDILTSDNIAKNLDIIFEADIKNVAVRENKIEKVEITSGILSLPIESIYFVDSTGSAVLSKLSGCNFLNDNEQKQQNSLRFILGNVDVEKFCKFIKEVDKDVDVTNTYQNNCDTFDELHFTTASTWDTNKNWAIDKYLKHAVKDGVLLESDRAYFQVFSVARAPGLVAFNCPRIDNYNFDPYMSSRELIKAREAIWRLYNFVRKYFPGFENSIITNIAAQTGVRELARVKTKYVYTKDNLIDSKKFANPILCANYSIDVHSNKKDCSILKKTNTYQLPIESLMSADIDNLFVAGKNVGADFLAHSALRVQKSCMSMGEGIARYVFNKLSK